MNSVDAGRITIRTHSKSREPACANNLKLPAMRACAQSRAAKDSTLVVPTASQRGLTSRPVKEFATWKYPKMGDCRSVSSIRTVPQLRTRTPSFTELRDWIVCWTHSESKALTTCSRCSSPHNQSLQERPHVRGRRSLPSATGKRLARDTCCPRGTKENNEGNSLQS